MDADERSARDGVVAAARELDAQGLNRGTSGNVSARFGDGLLITPSGVPTAALSAEDIVPMGLDGSHPPGMKPSSEWRFHRDILAARREVGAVVHAHPVHCTAFAMCGREIPAVHYMIAAFG
ncbi:MAG: class II aldolase/adducin family protein, partial [Parafilimonas terrae]|nr:class II aldolase/adducin family protein [Parafilimonas terrae]